MGPGGGGQVLQWVTALSGLRRDSCAQQPERRGNLNRCRCWNPGNKSLTTVVLVESAMKEQKRDNGRFCEGTACKGRQSSGRWLGEGSPGRRVEPAQE